MTNSNSEPTRSRPRTARVLAWCLALLVLVGGGVFLRYFPWVPFHPVCVPNHDERGYWEGFLWGAFMKLRGTLRDDFKRVAMDGLYPRLVTRDGLYVTIDFYLDTEFYHNMTRGIVGSLVFQEFNPEFFDSYGRWSPDWQEKEKAGGVIEIPRRNIKRECEFTRFFAIEGAPPPKNIRQAFAETHYDHSQEFIDQGVRIMDHFIAKYAED